MTMRCSRLLSCFLFIGISLDIFSSLGQAMETTSDLYERAEYYLQELSNALQQIHSSHNIRKRSVDELDDKILTHLRAICTHLDVNDLQGESGNTTSQEGVGDGEDEQSTPTPWTPEEDKWEKPHLYVTNGQAERDGDNVTYTFVVAHTGQASITRQMSFDRYTALIGEAGEYGEMRTSNVTLSLAASECDPAQSNEYKEKVADYHISLLSDSVYSMELSTEFCRFDLSRNSTTSEWERKRGVVFSKGFDVPEIQLLSDVTDEILITPGENPKIDLAVRLFKSTSFFASVNLWDWDANLNETLIWYAEYGRAEGGYANESLVRMTTLNEERVNYSRVGETVVILRIEVLIGSKNMSGQLELTSRIVDHSWDPPPFVKSVRMNRMLWLKLPYKLSALPRNHVEIFASDSRCDGIHLREHGSCIVDCFAEGTDMKSFFLIKSNPYTPPIKDVSYVLDGRKAFAMNDMGQPSRRNEGVYQCVVITENGKVTRRDFKLLTLGFSHIDSIDATEFGNGTVRISCSASGYQPLQISLGVVDGYFDPRALGENDEDVVWQSTVDNTTTLTLWVRREDFVPRHEHELECRATGPRGEESKVEKIKLIGQVP